MGFREEWEKAKQQNGLGQGGGIAQQTKANTIADEARKASAAGDRYFTPVLNMPATHHTMSGNIRDWALMLAAITEAGWTLQHWTAGQDKNGHPEAYPVFVRR